MSTFTNDLSREERETIIRRSDADKTWTIHTSSPIVARKLEKLCDAMGITLTKISEWTWMCIVPLSCVSLRRLVQISDAERIRRSARLAATRTKGE